MASLDDIFPNHKDCYFSLFQDAVFEHDEHYNYRINNGKFIRRNRVVVAQRIGEFVDILYDDFITNNNSFSRLNPHIDYVALVTVLDRYSRDIYGCRRIKAKIMDIEAHVDSSLLSGLEQIISDSADFGLKIPSGNPYIERQASVLLYWFSVLKPFHFDYRAGGVAPPPDYIVSYFNEYLAYHLICLALYTQSVTLTIHKNIEVFKEFLNQLHFRNLSRSSLEFFLPYSK
ncbi:hypothetical protein ACYULU_12260 [Breznakiellaceae bacterium SP9]